MGRGYRTRRRSRRRTGVPVQLLAMIIIGVCGMLWQWTSQADVPARMTMLAKTTLAPSPALIRGRASVIDGDTVEISGQRIRFNGIDAPESRQYCFDAKDFEYPCGRRSAQALDEFLAASRPLVCSFVSWDQYGRYVGDCARSDGRSVQSWLVQQGHALDWPRYSNGQFAREQDEAAKAQRGVWSGRFDPPWDWRAANAGKLETVAQPSAGAGLVSGTCSIKGNISASGERIYHVPGQKYYAATRIDTSKGERWFCSEAEARAAGWRRSKR